MNGFRKLLLAACTGLTMPAPFAQARQAFRACIDQAGTQADLNDRAAQTAESAERALNETYHAILKKYSDRPLFIRRLREAQRAWLKFRGAQLSMRFPAKAAANAQEEYGSVYPMCYAEYKSELTRQRTEDLQRWLDGVQEGDVCAGSVKRAVKPK